MPLLYLMLLALPAATQVTVAPDQPLSYVYVDDPLIIEFFSEQETNIDAQMTIGASHQTETTTIDFGKLHLHADSGYWHAVHNAPRDKGFYTATITMRDDTNTTTAQINFCRIDRPSSLKHIPLYAYCDNIDEACAFPAIHSVGIDTFRCDVSNNQFMEVARNISLYESNLIVAMPLNDTHQIADVEIERIKSQCKNIFRLDISLASVDKTMPNIPDILREVGCPAGISIVIPSAAAFEQQLMATPSLSAKHATLLTVVWPEPSEIRAIQNIALRQGQEGWQVHVLCPTWKPRNNTETIKFIHRFLQYRAAKASFIGINAAVLADKSGVYEMMAYMNGLALRFHDNSYVGTLPTEGNAQALVFRKGASWFAALWSEKGDETLYVPVDGAINLKLSDARGNELVLPEAKDGSLAFSVTPDPLYLTGEGGIILSRAALQQVTQEARNITQSEIMMTQLPAAIPELIAAIVAEPQSTGSRLRFLDLLRALPRIEELWHTRKLPRDVAVPAIASISKLARSLCLIEEDRGERFLEPISDTIDRAEELQSLYLTGSAGTAQTRKRGDWILGEVRRLIDEAEILNEDGRKIEATAVAALAEWRAHCLLHATKAETPRESPPAIQAINLPEPIEETTDTPVDDTTTESIQEVGEAEQASDSDEEDIDGDPESKVKSELKTEDSVEDAQDKTKNNKEVVHKVKSGDNLYTIAKKYGVPLDNLLQWNNLKKKSILRIGQELIIKTEE